MATFESVTASNGLEKYRHYLQDKGIEVSNAVNPVYGIVKEVPGDFSPQLIGRVIYLSYESAEKTLKREYRNLQGDFSVVQIPIAKEEQT